MSKLFGRAGHLLRLADEKGLDESGFDILIESGFQADMFEAIAKGLLPNVNRDKLRELLGLEPLQLLISVADNATLEELIEAGHYDYANPKINASNFSVESWNGERIVELTHFNRNMSSDDVEKELDKKGLRSGTITELIAFGAMYPEIQCKFPIVALGSVASVGGGSLVAYFVGGGSNRYLDLHWYDDDWRRACRFLAVRKISES